MLPSGVAVEMTDPLYVAPSLDLELQDVVFLQNLPSVITSHVLDPQAGETVLDMCAAPGVFEILDLLQQVVILLVPCCSLASRVLCKSPLLRIVPLLL